MFIDPLLACLLKVTPHSEQHTQAATKSGTKVQSDFANCRKSYLNFYMMLTKKTILILCLIFGGAVALQCDIPGECTGEFIAFTSENYSTDCLATCKGTYNNYTHIIRINLTSYSRKKLINGSTGTCFLQNITIFNMYWQ